MGRGVGWPQWSTRCQLVSARGSPPCPRGPYSRGNTLFPTKERHTHTHVSTPPPLYFSLFSFLSLSPSPPTKARACGRGRTYQRCVTQTEVRFFFLSLSLSRLFFFKSRLFCTVFPKSLADSGGVERNKSKK